MADEPLRPACRGMVVSYDRVKFFSGERLMPCASHHSMKVCTIAWTTVPQYHMTVTSKLFVITSEGAKQGAA